MTIRFGAVADDDTGATDLAGMLAEQGVRTVLAIDIPSSEKLGRIAEGAEAVVIAVASRNLTPAEAYERTRSAVRLLAELSPQAIQIKYCSTFDSTAEGNIGPSIDAAMDEIGEAFTVAVPALPVNGRTTYLGYHFVGQQLLSESPMRHHPLTPMTDSNLVRHLGRQTTRKVGLAPLAVVKQGAETLRQHFALLQSSGVQIAIVDCTSDADLQIICQAIGGMRLVTGGSGLGIGLPTVWAGSGWRPTDTSATTGIGARGQGFLIVSGSCSEATRRQNEWLLAQGTPDMALDAIQLATSQCDQASIVDEATRQLARGATCLLRTGNSPAEVERVHQWGRQAGHGLGGSGRAISESLASLVRRIFDRHPPAGLVVAGGETSGAICRGLEFDGLRVGKNIEPGVPLCTSLGRFSLPVVLKSGNFGSADFYGRAIAALHTRPASQ